mmetsp:Transcript_19528/g.59073  ORF Transcript_19528/g.59073 Transcript_19528/m.59073 type:complete len:121 (-) Transcript_19528:98-460(-)|eukprot:CAMPEP_0118882010 /NCGR_PEP_ID=MMETSP1163-20130328/21369_1 /TAXON_ID=124430 /ORGANISM="Phaeomonas parva, Strain CCMP2877" /LENGTH=120 /DNA_ID=CAMNT_0006818953 /DNA_START=238 /DNA_END=600 /DNA_ORIENTATION=+
MDFQDDSAEFSVENVQMIVKNTIVQTIADHIYNAKQVDGWVNVIVETCLKHLQNLNRPFKYLITCVITQMNGAGMNTATAQYWDQSKDGVASIAYNNGNMHCVVTVFGLCVHIDDPQEEI